MFTREFTHSGSNTRVTVILNPKGWELRQESEQGVIQRNFYRDWHRVERAAAIFRLQVADLISRGWELRRVTP